MPFLLDSAEHDSQSCDISFLCFYIIHKQVLLLYEHIYPNHTNVCLLNLKISR